MNILITNDDGIFSEGLKNLASELNNISNIFIVAPDRERSGTGHAITVYKPLMAKEVVLFKDNSLNTNIWSISGTPSDCVKLALEELLPVKPDFVVSGINDGPNLGRDIFYSGTVSAAIEGSFYNIPSIAISMYVKSSYIKYKKAAEFTKFFIEQIKNRNIPNNVVFNINYPSFKNKVCSVETTNLGLRKYRNSFKKRYDPRGNIYFWMSGQVNEEEEKVNSDVWAVKNNKISITPIEYHFTDNQFIEVIRNWNINYLED